MELTEKAGIRIPIDERVIIEEVTGLVLSSERSLRETVTMNCWGSLLSDRDKRLRYESLEHEYCGFNRPLGGNIDNFYVFEINGGSKRPYQIVNESISTLASKLKFNVNYEPNREMTGAFFYRIDSKKWEEIPDHIAMQMLEEIEHSLANAEIAALYFDDFYSATELLRSFGFKMVTHPNVAVYMSSSFPLDSINLEPLPENIETMITTESSSVLSRGLASSCILVA
ncbi:hypothetical protein AAFX24_28585 [Vibrio mediterranei]|uniref:hypothetical protein n=1 Tax=Vibrio mediterranei TaxID=689 RepID=UPI0038CE1136